MVSRSAALGVKLEPVFQLTGARAFAVGVLAALGEHEAGLGAGATGYADQVKAVAGDALSHFVTS